MLNESQQCIMEIPVGDNNGTTFKHKPKRETAEERHEGVTVIHLLTCY